MPNLCLDETGATIRMTGLRGRSFKRERLHGKTSFGHWATQTFVTVGKIHTLWNAIDNICALFTPEECSTCSAAAEYGLFDRPMYQTQRGPSRFLRSVAPFGAIRYA